MNKKLKRFIGIVIAVNVVCTIGGGSALVGMKSAYAKDVTSVYLKNIRLSKSNIDFSEDVYYYTTSVDRDANDIKITARPKSEDAFVTINDDQVDEDNDYKKVIDLEKGNNIVKIKVTNDDNEEKVYVVNIVQGQGEDDPIYLDSLKINNQSVSNFSKEKADYDFSVKEDVKEVSITAEPEKDMTEISIDGGSANKENNYTVPVELEKGINPILIKVKNKKNNDTRDYLININRANNIENNKSLNDDIDLDYIKLNDQEMKLSRNVNEYTLNYKENTSGLYIKADPGSKNYKVIINDKVVEQGDDYKDFVDLKSGLNIVKIKVQDLKNNKQRIYTLNINVGNTQSKNTINTSISNTAKYNQWIQSQNGWQYYDATGNVLKNTWFSDINNGKEYYLNENGIMSVNWLSLNGCWYYLGSDGAKEKDWQYINNNWYYFDESGVMKTGWLKNSDGKWYYLNNSGAMEKNTNIDGYKLGNDGAMV